MAAPSNDLFPEIGKVADDTDRQQERKESVEVAGDDDERAVQEIESLCMKCHEQVCRTSCLRWICRVDDARNILQGVTRLLLTSIPFFREVIVMSFRCEHCGLQNNEIQSAGQLRRKHVGSLDIDD